EAGEPRGAGRSRRCARRARQSQHHTGPAVGDGEGGGNRCRHRDRRSGRRGARSCRRRHAARRAGRVLRDCVDRGVPVGDPGTAGNAGGTAGNGGSAKDEEEVEALDDRSDPRRRGRGRERHQQLDQRSLRQLDAGATRLDIDAGLQGLMKRAYREARVTPAEGGWRILLDDRILQTPAKASLLLPTRGLAEAVAAEWAAQKETIIPASIPLMRLAATAVAPV